MKLFRAHVFIIAIFLNYIHTALSNSSMSNYCATPPFLSTEVPPNVMIMLSIETPMQGTAHPGTECSGDKTNSYSCKLKSCVKETSSMDWVYVSDCYDNEKEYYGYFDPDKCYEYDKNSKTFIPSSKTENHICTGKWSGNFLNWATMTSVDTFRKIMTGGNRVVDTKEKTILLGARQTIPVRVWKDSEIYDDWNLWFPIKKTTEADNYTPYSGTIYLIRYSNGFVVCRDLNGDDLPDCVIKENKNSSNPEEWFPKFPKKSGVCKNDIWTRCSTKSDCGGSKCLKGKVDSFLLRVEVCNKDIGLENNCKKYGNNTYKPVGVIQKYADKMRFGLFSYALKNNPDFNRNGGILRENIKWISDKIPYGLKYYDENGDIVLCKTKGGCDNPRKEIDNDGIFIDNPDNFSTGNSGLINYINKFGYASGYKSYDPVSEMYYEIIRYFKNLSPTQDYCEGLDNIDDGFPVFCNQSEKLKWLDPILYSCQKNFIIAINDAYPWLDKKVSGTAAEEHYKEEGYCIKRYNKNGKICEKYGGKGKCVACADDFGEPDGSTSEINASYWTDKVGDDEGLTPGEICTGCVLGGECDWNDTKKYVSNLSKAVGTCPGSGRENSYYMAGLAYFAHNTDLRKDIDGFQNITTYMIDTQEQNENMAVGNLNVLYLAAKYGGFIDVNDNNKPDLEVEWDKDGDGLPDTYFLASNPTDMETGLKKAFKSILKRTASGTAISSLSGRRKKSAIVVQAAFYPRKDIEDIKLSWVGNLYTYWFYNSRKIQNLREDSNENKALDKLTDLIINIDLDNDGNLSIKAYEPDVNGDKSYVTQIYPSLDNVKSIWDAGEVLLNVSSVDRKIYTVVSNSLIQFFENNDTLFQELLGKEENIPDCLGGTYNEKVENLIKYIRGEDIEGCRNRKIDNYGDTWKLGDIIYSTPTIATYKNKGYSVVFTGANDGMLHAFKVGYISRDGLSEDQVAKLQNSETDTGTDKLGEELWAFIPKNALPYLRYLPDPNYCHLYFVDLTPYIVEEKGKKILIGGMRLGGACGCSSTNCVKPPSDTCPLDSGECVGLSSYFALDITDPENPQFLWEFTDEDLGFSFSGPGIIKKRDKTYVIFASGPTNYKGDSNQNLFLYILDLYTGEVLRKIDTHIQNAFGGRLLTYGLDYDNNRETDYIALGFSRKIKGDWKGGVIWLNTINDDPNLWDFETPYKTNNPITSKVTFMKCFNYTYMYFGTGKWFYKTDEAVIEQPNRIYGIRLNCNDTLNGCSIYKTFSKGPSDACEAKPPLSWYIDLDRGGDYYFPERIITDPTDTKQNIIIFTATEPTEDVCGFGGRTRVWVLNCATGGSLAEDCAQYPLKKLEGKLLLQLSGGDIRQIDIKEFLPEKINKANTEWMTGTPPETQTPLITTGKIKSKKGEILLWLEK